MSGDLGDDATVDVPGPRARARDALRASLAAVRGLRRDEIGKLVGLVSAAVCGVLVNVYSARHYSRWDVTVERRYTLSEATKTTLRELHGPVEIWVMLGSQEPLRQSVTQILASYSAEAPSLVVKMVDPDKDVLALEDLKKRFKIEAGRSEDGHVLTDAVIVVANGERRWFLDTTDLYEASAKDDTKVRPREEEALTLAIRNVVRAGERARLCFAEGHGEASTQDASERGLFFLKTVLEKDNFEVTSVDTVKPNVAEPFKGCSVVIVPGPRGAYTPDESNRLRTYLLTGGSALLALGPTPTDKGIEPTGLDEVAMPFGVRIGASIVIETEKDRVLPDSYGVRFFASPRPHAVTGGLVPRDEREVPRMLVQLTRPLYHHGAEGVPIAADLAVSSAESFGLSVVDGAATWTKTPDKRPSDPSGPFVVAMAAERAKIATSDPHGPRLVVLGASTALVEANFREPWALRGTALLVENSLAWLATKPEILDIPPRAEVAAGVRITEESRSEVRRYVIVFMPLAVALLGLAVGFRRRSTEGRAYVPKDGTNGGKKTPKRARAKSKPKGNANPDGGHESGPEPAREAAKDDSPGSE